MRAGFCDEHARPGGETVNGPGAFDKDLHVALGGGQQNGKGGQRGFGGKDFVDGAEYRRVGDGQCRQGPQAGQGGGQRRGRAAERRATAVEQFADDLHLRQDQAALGRLAVLRHDQQHGVAGRHQVAGQKAFLLPGNDRCDALQQRFDGFSVPVDHDRDV